MKVKRNEVDGKFHLTYIKTQTNHDSEVEHCSLDEGTKSMIYGLLLKGLEPKVIVGKLLSDDETNRLYYLKVRDVMNICRDTGIGLLDRGQMHTDDATSVQIFVENEVKIGSVIAYKPNNVKHPDYPDLDQKDFIIAIMTDYQVECCKFLDDDYSVICVDATHGVGHNYKLITVLTVNDLYQGQPIAFCISKFETIEVLRYFFNAIKKRVGKALITKDFMSDGADYQYETWKAVMDPKNIFKINKWICIWHINQTFKRNIQKRIKDVEKRKKQGDLLQSFLYELDDTKFNEKLEAFEGQFKKLDKLKEQEESEKLQGESQTPSTIPSTIPNNTSDQQNDGSNSEFDLDLKDFLNFLQKNYFNRKEEWALFYRNTTSLTTNMHLEAFHKTFKHSYLKNTTNLRVDFTIKMLFQYLNAKERAYKHSKVFGLNSIRNSHVLTLHNVALKDFDLYKIEMCNANDQHFLVQRSNTKSIYKIEQIKDLSEVNSCKKCFLFCRDCKVCHHFFSCTCQDYMLKHMLC